MRSIQQPWLRLQEGFIPALIILPDSNSLYLVLAQLEIIVQMLSRVSD